MKKHFLLFLGIIFNFYVSNGQSVSIDVKKSEVFTDEVKNSIIVLGEKTSDDGILIVRSYRANFISPSNGYYIEKYNADLKLIKEFDYRLKSDLSQKHNVTLGVFYANNNVTIVELFYDLKEKHFLCQAISIDENFNLTTKELFRISREKMKIYGNFNLQQKFIESNSNAMRDLNNGEFSNAIDKNYRFSIFGKATISKENRSDIILVLSENKLSYSIVLD